MFRLFLTSLLLQFCMVSTVLAKTDPKEAIGEDWDSLSNTLGRFEVGQASEADVKKALSQLAKDGLPQVAQLKPEDYKYAHVANCGGTYSIRLLKPDGTTYIMSSPNSTLQADISRCALAGDRVVRGSLTQTAK